MPFKSREQRIFLMMNKPSIYKRWKKEEDAKRRRMRNRRKKQKKKRT